MSVTLPWRAVAVVGASALAAALLAALPQQADAARACRIPVTTRVDLTERFAGRGVSTYAFATAKGSAVGQLDHSGNVIMTRFPSGAYPTLINQKIGERAPIGAMTKAQAPQALGSINADFFVFADVRYATHMEMARGPMVKGGALVRATSRPLRVVGVDTLGQPFGGDLKLRGSVRAKIPGAKKIPLRSVNWHALQSAGANIYTSDWSGVTNAGGVATYPRPAGVVEWVLNGRNKIKTIRSSASGAANLGAPVASGTKVVAFSADASAGTTAVPLGTKVRVTERQVTNTGVTLKTAVGRGLPLVEGGKPAPLGCRAYAKTAGAKAARPRTFVGWDGKGRWRTFTVPGSNVAEPNGNLQRTGGFSLANAANIAKVLGMKYAYELDGGGSTSLWTRKKSNWTRKDLYGVANPSKCACERWMANGLAFVAGP